MFTLFDIDNAGTCYEVNLLDLINESETTVTPTPDASATTVKVTGLTGSNITALGQVADHLQIAHIGKTVCTFDGTAAEALTALRAAIDAASREYGSRSFTVRSLHAVRRKLEAMV